MATNLDALKAKFNELSNKPKMSDILWKPQEGANQIRIVPSATDSENPFTELHIHFIGGKSYLSPLTFGDPDPIVEFGEHLRSSGGRLEKAEWDETKKFFPSMRTFARVVIRGKESEGVKFWGFGKTTYKDLAGFFADPEYGDIVDPKEGRDVKVEFTPKEKSSTKRFPETKIKVSVKQTPLATDKELFSKLLTDQPNIFDVYKKVSYEELQSVLEKFLNPNTSPSQSPPPIEVNSPNDDWGTGEVVNPAADVVSPTAAASKKSSSKTPKDIDKEFADMFEK